MKRLLSIIALSMSLVSCGDSPPGPAVIPEKYAILTVGDLPSNSEHYWIEVEAIVVDASGKVSVDTSAKDTTAKDATHVVEIYKLNGYVRAIVHGDVKWKYWPKSTVSVVDISAGDIPVEKGSK